MFCLFFIMSASAWSVSGAPQVAGISPAQVTAGSTGFTLVVAGGNFAMNATVRVNGSARPTTYSIFSQSLKATIPATDLTATGSLNITVLNPGTGGGESLPLTLTVTSTPLPLVGTLTPPRVTAGSASFTLLVDGSNFGSDSVVQVNGASRTTTFVSSGRLSAVILSTDVAASGFPAITVFRPSTGTTSNAASLTVFRYGDLDFSNVIDIVDLVAMGNFLAGNFVPDDTITADLNLDGFFDASDLLTLANYLAGNIHSLPANIPPLIESLSPTKVTAGLAPVTLTVNGKFFPHDSVVQINGAGRATVFVSPVQLTATLPAGDIASSGFPNVTVLAPSTGAVSNVEPLTVFRYGDLNFDNTIDAADLVAMANSIGGSLTLPDPIAADVNLDGFIDATDLAILANYLAGNIPSLPASLPPVIYNIAPGKIVAGSQSFTLSVGGKYFPHNAVVQINGANRATTFVNTVHVTATILAGDIATSGFPNITVLAPSNGAVSNAVSLKVFRYCDVSFDNVINILDLVTFANYLGGHITSIDPDAADVNLDGRIDSLDLLLCGNYLAGNIHILPVPASDFSISASPALLTVTAGDNANFLVSTSGLNGAIGNVELSLSGLPAGNAGFSPPAIVGNGTSTLTLLTSPSSMPPAIYSVRITGTSGAFSHTAVVTLQVVAPPPPPPPPDSPPCDAGGGGVKDIQTPCLSN